jgi:hypothetical protein
MAKIKLDKQEEEVQEGQIVESSWDLKKILIGGFVIVTLFLFALIIFFPGKNSGRKPVTLGAQTDRQQLTPTPPLPDKEDVQNIINSAKDTLSQITSENLSSSESAIQKVISDLQSLQAGSGSAVDVFCNFVCKK